MQKPKQQGELYPWYTSTPSHTYYYLGPVVLRMCRQVGARSVLDLGCGNGAQAAALAAAGFAVTGVEPESSGVELAQQAAPGARFLVGSVYDDPVALAQFDAVVSTEVVEHLLLPKALPRYAYAALKPGGYLIISTPYYGYMKNLGLSVLNRWDSAHSPLWDGGHVKFWSRKTLTELLQAEGFQVREFVGAGRVPYLWKSMVLLAQRD